MLVGRGNLSHHSRARGGVGFMMSRAMELCVLLVEDDDENRAMVATALRADGHVVIEAVTGVEGLSRYTSLLAADITPNVVISDSWMPGMRGLSFVACLRGSGCTCPVLLITAHDTPETRAQAHTLDVEVIPKPFDIEALRAKVSALSPRAA
jgi:two-component system, OmpR family, response regulator